MFVGYLFGGVDVRELFGVALKGPLESGGKPYLCKNSGIDVDRRIGALGAP